MLQGIMERLLETVERFEEDLTDRSRVHALMQVNVMIGDSIVVSPERERGGEHPLLAEIERRLQKMLGISS